MTAGMMTSGKIQADGMTAGTIPAGRAIVTAGMTPGGDTTATAGMTMTGGMRTICGMSLRRRKKAA